MPDATDRLPWRTVEATAALWWVGAHGGAGETTLSRLLPGSRAGGHAWPCTSLAPALPVVLVARTSMHGLCRAQQAGTHWASGEVPGVELLGLVLVADAPGRLPRPLRDLADVVAGGVPRVWRVPWVEAWRVVEHPAPGDLPRDVQRMLADLQALTTDPPPTTDQE